MADSIKYYRIDDPNTVVDVEGIRAYSKSKDPKNSAIYDALSPKEIASEAVSQKKWAPVTTKPTPSGVVDKAKSTLTERWIDPALSMGANVWNGAVDFARGGTATAIFKPVETITSALGYDPAKTEVPLSGTFKSEYPFISENRTVSELAKVPEDSMAAKAGAIAGEAAQFVDPGLATAAIPKKLAIEILKRTGSRAAAKAVAISGRAAVEGGIAGAQVALQGEDPAESINALMTSALLSGPAYKITTAAGKYLATKGRRWYEQALSLPQATDLNYGQKLIDRGLETLTKVNKEGLNQAKGRFRTTVAGMKEASKQAEARGVVFDSQQVQNRLVELINQTALPKDKTTIGTLAQDLINEYFPTGSITPTQAEAIKEKFNHSLGKFYKKAKEAGVSSDAITDEVMNTFLGGIKDMQQSLITETVNVGGKLIPYREAAKIASLDADLMSLIDRSMRAERSTRSGLTSMIEGSAYGSLAKGSLFTPAQFGVLEKIGKTPERMSNYGPSLIAKGKSMVNSGGSTAVPMVGVASSHQMKRADISSDESTVINDWSRNPYK